MKKLFIASFMMLTISLISQEEAKFTVEISSDSVLLGNYIEVKFTIENTAVKNFEAPNFEGFSIVSGPNQSSSMRIINGQVSQSISYSYYLEPNDIGNYYIQPAFVDTGEEILESAPIEVLVADNPDGIIQQPRQNSPNDFFNDFFERNRSPFFHFEKPAKPKKKKKKRKVYRI